MTMEPELQETEFMYDESDGPRDTYNLCRRDSVAL